MKTAVVYDRETKRVIVFKVGDNWVMPCSMELAVFDNGAEPVLVDVNGDMYIKDNALIIRGWG